MNSLSSKLIIFLSIIGFLLVMELSWWVIFVHISTDENYDTTLEDLERIELLSNNFYQAATDKEHAKRIIISNNPSLFFDGHKFLINQQRVIELKNNAKKNKRMFLYESLVFFVLILIGFIYLYRSMKREFEIGKQQHNFMLSITHELKTPLASIKLFLQTLIARKNLTEEKRAKFLSNSISEVNRLNTLVDNILQSVKLERNPTVVQDKIYPLSTAISQSLSKFKLDSSIKLEHHLDDTINHNIHPDMISIIINNLVGNAIKYNDDITISVSLSVKNQFIHFIVSDNGVGIPENEREKIFDRFYRVGEEETRKASGTGLGLYIVKKIVLACNGNVECLQNKPTGTLFLIKLPILKDA